MKIDLIKGDCLEIMKDIPANSIDCIICDLPYGTTAHSWDAVIPFDKLWEQYHRLLKSDGIVALFGTEPFSSMLRTSNLSEYRYDWIWKKNSPNGFLNCNYAPLKITETISIFSSCTIGSLSKNPIRYFPVGTEDVNIEKRNNPNSKYRRTNGYSSMNNVLNSDKLYVQKKKGYPTNILEFERDREHLHPTQKPVALLEYLVKTYTNEGDTVLDNCMGSGTTGVACKNLGRNFIGIEKEQKYFEIAQKRIFEKSKELHNDLIDKLQDTKIVKQQLW